MSKQNSKPNQVDIKTLLREMQELKREVAILKNQQMSVGYGNDDHRIETPEKVTAESRQIKPVKLAGVIVSTEYSIDANSDGDLVYHTVMNGLLGASGKRDIGYHFPDAKDAGYTNANSADLMGQVMGWVKADGWRVNNVVVAITAGKPRLKNYIEEMRTNLANALEIDLKTDPWRVAIHATTGEKLSEVAKGNGIHADATVFLLRIKE